MTRTANDVSLEVRPEASQTLNRAQVKLKTQRRKKEIVFCTLCICVFCDACGIGFLLPVISYMTGNQVRAMERGVLGCTRFTRRALPFPGRVSVYPARRE